jgi:dolichol-phosphate mannosyltransferase
LDEPDYSLVIPVYNERACLPTLEERLRELLDRLDGPAEVVFVDDGSTDGSYEIIADICGRDRRFKFLRLSRNFGHQLAITAGLDATSGRAVVVMDADLQDPPEVVLRFAEQWRGGCDVVHGVRERREGESTFKTASASWFYRLLARIGDTDAAENAGDFRLIDRRALDAFLSMRERNRYVRGMIGWIGFRQCTVTYVRAPRFAGTTKYPLRRMVRLAFDGIFSFSSAPLRFALRFGFLLSALSIAAGIVTIVLKLSGALYVPGWTSLLVAVTFLGGVQLLTIGLMGEYVSRIYDEVRGRPLYLIREARGFETAVLPSPMPAARAEAPLGDPHESVSRRR